MMGDGAALWSDSLWRFGLGSSISSDSITLVPPDRLGGPWMITQLSSPSSLSSPTGTSRSNSPQRTHTMLYVFVAG